MAHSIPLTLLPDSSLTSLKADALRSLIPLAAVSILLPLVSTACASVPWTWTRPRASPPPLLAPLPMR